MLPGINLQSWLGRVVFLLHFHRLSVGCLLLFGHQRIFITRTLVHEGSVLSAELLSHPLGTGAPCRGGERLRTGCALSRLVAVQPLVDVSLTDHCAVVGHPLVDCASFSHRFPFLLLQGLQRSATLFAAESARVLQAHPCATTAIHHTAHSAAHKQHTHILSVSAMHSCKSPSAATEMAKSALAPCIISSVADLSRGWHADSPLVCACSARVSRSIPPPHVPPSSVDGCVPLLPREFPRGTGVLPK